MKKLIIVLAFLLSAGIAFAGGGFEPEQKGWSEPQQEQTTKTKKDNGLSTSDILYVVIGGSTVILTGAGLYLNSRRKKQ